MAKLICHACLRQFACLADAFARESAGSNNAARMAMMAITTNSSISVTPSRPSGLLFTPLWTTQRAVSHAAELVVIQLWISSQGAGSKAQGAEPQMDTDGHR